MARRTTIRIPEEKLELYQDFCKVVKDDLHSDICYVTVELWEAFLLALKNAPKPPKDPVELKFAKQNIQINLGCNFYYTPQKPRRKITPEVALNKNYFFPLLIEEWDTLKPEAKAYWRNKLMEAGIIEKPAVRIGYLAKIKRVMLAIIKKIGKLLKIFHSAGS